ncbi:hypothetical protein O6H91_23G025300 [Diphasiastrum complanatum]|nr:hypothetical protein O6H91_23G000600 [Diphasiastrum complanatum]KAJ7514069.1 hypothetical protein O6H91_23G025300 [Diphasiastrum complanatum]
MICPAKVEDVNFQCLNALPSRSTAAPSWAKVQLDNGRRLQTRLVIGADGGRSKVRNFAGIDTTGWKYNQQAVICTIGVETEHFTAWQRFLPTGPLALLPLGGKFSNIVWSTTPEKAESLKSLTSEQFVNAVNRALTEDYGPKPQSGSVHHLMSKILSPFTGGSTPSVEEDFMFPPKVISLESQRLSFPLSLSHANKYVAHRLALVGDAAHTVHPLAGQGVNLGFGDAASIANILSEAITFGEDIGERSVLQRYEKERMSANVLMMAILDGFQRVFSVDFGPFNVVRAGGFSTVQNFGPLKKLITSYAMGKSVHM